MHTSIGAVNALYPMPAALAGTLLADRANFLPVVHLGILDFQTISISLIQENASTAAIRKHQVFSLCLPSQDLADKVDACGLTSGKTIDKSALFTVFFGGMPHAPLIRECPICMECRVVATHNLGQHCVFVANIEQTHAEESILEQGKIQLARVRPLMFSMQEKLYWSLGQPVGQAWKVGMGRVDELEKNP